MRNTYETKKDPLHHVTMTSLLLECANQLACNRDNTTDRFVHDLLIIAAERTRDLMEMLEDGEIRRGEEQ